MGLRGGVLAHDRHNVIELERIGRFFAMMRPPAPL
jgi:hypothetical protein